MVSIVQPSFVAGEWSPELQARFDLPLHRASARLIKNFIVTHQGALTKRPGTRFVSKLPHRFRIGTYWYDISTYRIFPYAYGSTNYLLLVAFGKCDATGEINVAIYPVRDDKLIIDTSRVDTYTWLNYAPFGATVYYSDKSPEDTASGKHPDYLYVWDSTGPTYLVNAGDAFNYPGYGLDLRSPEVQWERTSAGSPTLYEYYVKQIGTGTPGLDIPCTVRSLLRDMLLTKGTVGSLAQGEWGWGDNDSLGYDTLYVRLPADADPSTYPISRGLEACYPRYIPEGSFAYGPPPGGWANFVLWVNYGSTANLKASPVLNILTQSTYFDMRYPEADCKKLSACQKDGRIWFFMPGLPTYIIERSNSSSDMTPGDWSMEDFEYTYAHKFPYTGPVSPTPSNTQINHRNAQYKWKPYAGTSSTIWYLTLADGSNPKLGKPDTVYGGGTALTEVNAFSLLTSGKWWWGDNDKLGFETIYLYDTTGGGPDNRTAGYYTAEYSNIEYVVTAVSDEGEESSFYANVTVGATEYIDKQKADTGVVNKLTWGPVTSVTVDHYNIYRKWNGQLSWLGSTHGDEAYFYVDQVIPDASKGPPNYLIFLEESSGHFILPVFRPNAGGFFQQRLIAGGFSDAPASLMGSVVGYPRDFLGQIPPQDDGGFLFQLNSIQPQEIRWIAPLRQLLVGTSYGEWILSANRPLTPTNVEAVQHGSWGSEQVAPTIAGHEVVFVQRGGNVLRALAYNLESDGYVSRDLTAFASHLFENTSIERLLFYQDRELGGVPLIWVLAGGAVYTLTLSSEQQVMAWARQEFVGSVEDVGNIGEAGVELPRLYMIRKNQPTWVPVYTLEKLAPPFEDRQIDSIHANFVDSHARVSGSGVSKIYGLEHLSGYLVHAIVDGTVYKDLEVEDGAVSLPTSGDDIVVGLPIVSEVETSDFAVMDQRGETVDKKATISSVVLSVLHSFKDALIGPSSEEAKLSIVTFPESGQSLFTGKVETNMMFEDSVYPKIYLKTDSPAGFTLLSLIARVDVGAF